MAATAEFDPNAYLAEKHAAEIAAADNGGFNPGEYLNAPKAAPAPVAAPVQRGGAATGMLAGLELGKPVPGTEGVVNFFKNAGLEGGGATLGQIAGAPFEEVGGVHIGGAIGGGIGNAIAQLTTPGKPFSFGDVAGAMAAGAIPGASLEKAGAKEVLKQGAKYAGANVVGTNLQSLIDQHKLASPTQDAIAAGTGFLGAPVSKALDSGAMAEASRVAAQRGSVKRETLKLGQELGLVVPPSAVAPNVVNDTAQSLAGKAATAQETILRNAPKVDEAIAQEIYGKNGVSVDAPFSPIALNTARVGPNMVYDQIAQSGPAAKGLLAQFKNATDQARELRSAYRASIEAGTPNNATLTAARAAETQADVFKQGIKKVIPPDIFDSFDAARTQLAKIGLAERAVNKGTGGIDPAVIGQAFDAGEKLTGNFKTIGRFENAFGKYIKDAASAPPSGVDYLRLASKIGAGGAALGTGHTGLAVAAPIAMAAAEKGTRGAILSPAYQKIMAAPHYGASTEDLQAGIARLGEMAAGREDAPLTEEEQKQLDALRARFSPAQ